MEIFLESHYISCYIPCDSFKLYHTFLSFVGTENTPNVVHFNRSLYVFVLTVRHLHFFLDKNDNAQRLARS